MNLRRLLPLLLLPACVLLFGQRAARAACPEDLRFGTVDASPGQLAIEPDTSFVFCPDTNVLVVDPDAVHEAQGALGATVLEDGTWITRNGQSVRPQSPSFVVFREGDEGIGSLPRIQPSEVTFANTSVQGACAQVLRGYRCYTTSQGGCNNGCVGTRLWQNGPAVFSYCERGAPADRCFQTAGSVTCTFTVFSGPGCGGQVVSTGTQTFPNCQ